VDTTLSAQRYAALSTFRRAPAADFLGHYGRAVADAAWARRRWVVAARARTAMATISIS
jgi:hypothetical protein